MGWPVLLFLCGALMACSVDSGKGEPTPSPTPHTCTVDETLGSLTIPFEGSVGDENGDLIVTVLGPVNTDTDPDYLEVSLWDGYGAFADGITAGTVEISGDEADILRCGACAILYGDVDISAGGTISQIYMASGGTIEITEVGTSAGDRVAGSISGVALREVSLEDGGEVGDACMSSVDDTSFDVTLEQAQ